MPATTKLTAAQVRNKEEVRAKLEKVRDELSDTIDDFNAQVLELFESLVQDKVNEYNQALSEVEAFRDEVVEEVEGYIADRSDKWQEGDRGIACQEWLDAWNDLDFEALEIEGPEGIEKPETEVVEEFQNLPDEMEG